MRLWYPLALFPMALLVACGARGFDPKPAIAPSADETIIDFSEEIPGEWYIVNDGVMGGVSESGMIRDDRGHAVFLGNLSLANNGGFASVRTRVSGDDLACADGLVLRVRGDGREYRVRVRTSEAFDGPAYGASFRSDSDWAEVRIPFESMVPTFRGRQLSGLPNVEPQDVRQLTLMVADKIEGRFRLEVQSIGVYTEASTADL